MKEAYVKMTGEALLAPWLKDLEFLNVRTPRHANELNLESEYGEAICDLYSERVRDVKLDSSLQRWLLGCCSLRSVNRFSSVYVPKS